MSDKSLKSRLYSAGVKTALCLFCSYILGFQLLHMHATNLIFGEQKMNTNQI